MSSTAGHTHALCSPQNVYEMGTEMMSLCTQCICVQKSCTRMLMAALFLVAPNWKQRKRLPAVKWINRLEIGVTTQQNTSQQGGWMNYWWMNLTNRMLREGRQAQESPYCVIPLVQSSRTGKTHLWRWRLQQWLPMEGWGRPAREAQRNFLEGWWVCFIFWWGVVYMCISIC